MLNMLCYYINYFLSSAQNTFLNIVNYVWIKFFLILISWVKKKWISSIKIVPNIKNINAYKCGIILNYNIFEYSSINLAYSKLMYYYLWIY